MAIKTFLLNLIESITNYEGGAWKCCKCGAQCHHSATCWDPVCNHNRCSGCKKYG